MNFRYTLEWLDLIICVTLNPDKTDLSAITEKQIEMIISQICEEKNKISSLLKNQVFGINKESQIELLIKKYHSALIILLDEAFENREKLLKQKHDLGSYTIILLPVLTNYFHLLKYAFHLT